MCIGHVWGSLLTCVPGLRVDTCVQIVSRSFFAKERDMEFVSDSNVRVCLSICLSVVVSVCGTCVLSPSRLKPACALFFLLGLLGMFL